uniref:Uncharacterized protein n=1 Tax=Heterorhabditis bacteriophora TaxID=37862 RepID=A0A1I7X4S6_HETBA
MFMLKCNTENTCFVNDAVQLGTCSEVTQQNIWRNTQLEQHSWSASEVIISHTAAKKYIHPNREQFQIIQRQNYNYRSNKFISFIRKYYSFNTSERSSSNSSISEQSFFSSDEEQSADDGKKMEIWKRNNEDRVDTSSKFSISNPELTSLQLKQMFPELSEHWRMMLALRKNSDDVFCGHSQSPPPKRDSRKKEPKKPVESRQSSPIWTRNKSTESASKESPKSKRKPSVAKKRSWRGEGAARKLSEALPAALRSPTTILRRKKPLGPSLSWDPEHRSRSPSSTSRSRIHSDGSEERTERRASEKDTGYIEEPRFELEVSCSHCALVADYRRRILKTEIESAVMRLARRLGNGRTQTWKDDGQRTVFGTPDIVVSSISSDEEEHGPERHTSSEMGSSLQTSETRSMGTLWDEASLSRLIISLLISSIGLALELLEQPAHSTKEMGFITFPPFFSRKYYFNYHLNSNYIYLYISSKDTTLFTSYLFSSKSSWTLLNSINFMYLFFGLFYFTAL